LLIWPIGVKGQMLNHPTIKRWSYSALNIYATQDAGIAGETSKWALLA